MKYIVSVPLIGAMHIEVEAPSAKAAKEAAWDAFNEKGETAGEVEWELVERITSGNVFHGSLNEISVDKVRP